MRMFKLLAAVALVALIAPLTVAQEAEKKSDRKTESTDKPDKSGENAEGDDFDRGDSEAEQLLKRAYRRVYSAESKGLKKLHAGSSIIVDATDMGMGELPFDGTLTWASDARAEWKSEAEGEGQNPMGRVSDVARQLFEPYLSYVTGFADWDSRFAEASFEFGDSQVDEEGNETSKTVVVTFADEDKPDATFAIADNKVISVTSTATFNEREAEVTHSYKYEDVGKHLRLSEVAASTKVDVSDLPGQGGDEKKPAPEGAQKVSLDGKIAVTKYGQAGEFEVALELEGELGMLGMKFPATLSLSGVKVNEEVKEEDLPDAEESDDEEF